MKTKRYIVLGILAVVVFLIGYCIKENEIVVEKEEETPVSNDAIFEEHGTISENVVNIGNETMSESTIEVKNEEDILKDKINEYLQKMTLEEKVAQLFIILPESLMENVECVTMAGNVTQNAINEIPVAGFIYMKKNLSSHEQVKAMLENVQKYSYERIKLPMFLCIDEEGGSVARIGNSGNFEVKKISDMSDIGKRKDVSEAYVIGTTIGQYLAEMGFNVNFAPVADVFTNSENQVIRKRSFGSDPNLVVSMTRAVAEGLATKDILVTYKHFPGHGDTAADTHEGYAYTNKTKEELYKCELIPFQDAIKNNVPFIMVGHISFPNIIGDGTPASISNTIVQDLLRDEMGYDGIIITDALNMGAIVQQYSSTEACIKAIEAGVDILLMPSDFKAAYKGIINAINEGEIKEERIDESLERILRVKIKMMEKYKEF